MTASIANGLQAQVYHGSHAMLASHYAADFGLVMSGGRASEYVTGTTLAPHHPRTTLAAAGCADAIRTVPMRPDADRHGSPTLKNPIRNDYGPCQTPLPALRRRPTGRGFRKRIDVNTLNGVTLRSRSVAAIRQPSRPAARVPTVSGG